MSDTTGFRTRTQNVRQSARDKLRELRAARVKARSATPDPAGLELTPAPVDALANDVAAALDAADEAMAISAEAAAPQDVADAVPAEMTLSEDVSNEDPQRQDLQPEDVAMQVALKIAPEAAPEPDLAAAEEMGSDQASSDQASPELASPELASPELASPELALEVVAEPVSSDDAEAADAANADEMEAADTDEVAAADDAPVPVVDETPAEEPVHEPTQAEAAETDLRTLPGVGPGLVWLLNEAGVRNLADLAQADGAELRERLGVLGQLLDLDGWIKMARERG